MFDNESFYICIYGQTEMKSNFPPRFFPLLSAKKINSAQWCPRGRNKEVSVMGAH